MALKIYSYKCTCGHLEDFLVEYDRRYEVQACPKCGGVMGWQFPLTFAFHQFQPYYDPALGLDLHTRRQKQVELRSRGLIEAGDPVGGARNFDKHAPHHMEPESLQGIGYEEIDRQRRMAEKAEENFKIGVAAPGEKVEYVRLADLPYAKEKKKP